MKKALIIATSAGFIVSFETNDIKLLQSMGYEVHCAANYEHINDPTKISKLKKMGVIEHELPFTRNPFSVRNLVAYRQLKRVLKSGEFELVHCHTPVGGVLGRMAAHRCRVPKVYYTAHGFHFYKGAHIINWIIYYPLEWLCSWWTDTLITINREDYNRAKQRLHARHIDYVPGVGVDTEKFGPNESGRERIRVELGLADGNTMLLSVGELNTNKNHAAVIRAVTGMDLTYVVVGKGALADNLATLARELDVDLRLPGYRADVADFYNAADIYVLPSIREGLNVSLMEAMASGLPCAASAIRGNVDLVDPTDGTTFKPNDIDGVRSAIMKALESRDQLGVKNLRRIRAFDIATIGALMIKIYHKLIA